MLAAAGVSTAYVADAVVFDGSNDYITTAANIAAADGKSGMLSFWINLNSGDGVQQLISFVGGGPWHIARQADNKFKIYLNTGSLNLITTATLVVASGWTHVLASWDVATGYSDIYFDDVQQALDTDTTTNTTLDYTYTSMGWMAGDTGILKVSADVFDFWMVLDGFLDLTTTSNRRLFIDAAGKPVDLGATGTLPGYTPRIFFHLDDGETANNFATNAGVGGTTTLVGTLATAATSPTD